ncbi:MAG: DUF4350 domain-containing protein [Gemmatimonadales bacterium]
MRSTFRPHSALAWAALSLATLAGRLAAQQVPDPDADLTVAHPAFQAPGPLVVIDGGHHNFHTIEGGYAPFAGLLRNDGLEVEGSPGPFTAASLRPVAILVIANPLAPVNAPANWTKPTPSAFTPEEIAAVRAFVERGGALFLIADHMPFAGAAHDLGAAFGVEFENGFAFSAPPGAPSAPDLFTRENGGLIDDPVVAGIRQVRTFTGSAFTAHGPGVHPLLRLGRGWTVLEPDTAWQFDARTPSKPGAGKLQGALIQMGRGRVAVFGEAAMFTAQLAGPDRVRVGFGAEGAEQNRQFLLDIVHWLARGQEDGRKSPG